MTPEKAKQILFSPPNSLPLKQSNECEKTAEDSSFLWFLILQQRNCNFPSSQTCFLPWAHNTLSSKHLSPTTSPTTPNPHSPCILITGRRSPESPTMIAASPWRNSQNSSASSKTTIALQLFNSSGKNSDPRDTSQSALLQKNCSTSEKVIRSWLFHYLRWQDSHQSEAAVRSWEKKERQCPKKMQGNTLKKTIVSFLKETTS